MQRTTDAAELPELVVAFAVRKFLENLVKVFEWIFFDGPIGSNRKCVEFCFYFEPFLSLTKKCEV